MNKVQIMKHMIGKYKKSMKRLNLDLKSTDLDKKERAADAIAYARKQIAEGEKIIKKEKARNDCSNNCAGCKNSLTNLEVQLS